MRLERIHYSENNFTVSDEQLDVPDTSTIAQLFFGNSERRVVRIAFLMSNGEEVVWRRDTL